MIAREEHTYDHIIKECFVTDADLLNKYHIEAPADADTCAKRTLDDLKTASNFKFYSLIEADEIAGFFGVSEVNGIFYCNGFFIKPKYRHFKNEFWQEVIKKTGDTFYTAIYPKNERAFKFLCKYGEIQEENEQYQLFKMKPCQ